MTHVTQVAVGLRATVELWRSSQTPAVLRASIRYRLPLNNSVMKPFETQDRI